MVAICGDGWLVGSWDETDRQHRRGNKTGVIFLDKIESLDWTGTGTALSTLHRIDVYAMPKK